MILSKKSLLAGSLAAVVFASAIASSMIPSMTDMTTYATYDMGSIDASELNMDGVNVTVKYISLAEGQAIDQAISDNVGSIYDAGSSSTIELRDWDDYISDYTHNKLSSNVHVLCDRLDAISRFYIENSDVDTTYVASLGEYFCNGAIYADLGFDSDEAVDIAKWFLYTHPQYYFIKPYFAITDSAVYIACYPSFSDGEERAAVTNSLFDRIDGWVESITDDEISTYQKELSAHKLLCDSLSYSSGTYDQSVYSAVCGNGQTVCVGYASAFAMIMNAADIQTLIGISDSHAWNVIKLDDGNWYGVDVTWNDTLGDRYLFNSGSDSFYSLDNSSEQHVYDDTCEAWYPVMATSNYSPNTYDLTGEYYDTDVYRFDRPYNVRHYEPATGVYRLTWATISGASYYDIEIYENGVLTGITSVSTNNIRFVNLNLANNVVVKIRACGTIDNTIGYSDWTSYEFEYTPPAESEVPEEPEEIVVSTPANLTYIPNSDNSVKILWDEVDYVSGYEVYVYNDAAYSDLLTSTAISSNVLFLRSLADSMTLYVRVRAFSTVDSDTYYSDWADICITTDFGDSGESGDPSDDPVTPPTPPSDETEEPTNPDDPGDTGEPSNGTDEPEIPSDPEEPEIPEEPVVPVVDVPTDLSVSVTTVNSVSFTWDTVDAADCYELKICTDAAGNSILATTRVNGTKVRLTGLTSTATYYVFVKAVDKDGLDEYQSDWASAEFCINDLLGSNDNSDTDEPSTPSSDGLSAPKVSLSKLNAASIRLMWNAVSAADYYTLEVYLDKDYTNYVTSMNLADVSMKLTSVSKNTYYVRIRAVNSESVSDWTYTTVAF